MSILKTIAKTLYVKFVPQAERETEVLEKLTEEQKSIFVASYLRKEAPLLLRTTPEYGIVKEAASDLVVVHHNATSFSAMCQSYIKQVMPNSFYLTSAINVLLVEVGAGINADRLLTALTTVIAESKSVKNPIKSRAIVRKGLNEVLDGLPSDKMALLIELVIAV